MNQVLISNLDNKSIFLVNDEKFPFYISIPNENELTITINLVDNPDLINLSKNNNPEEIKNRIEDIYNEYSQNNIAVVTPIINNAIMNEVKKNKDPKFTEYLQKAIAHIINKSYSTLKDNDKGVYKKIKLINNETYKGFNEKFSSIHSDRIELTFFDEEPIKKFDTQTNLPETPIGPTEEVLANTTSIALDEAYKEVSSDNNKKNTNTNKEPGFVSYVLLGVIVAVISLIGLYLLL